MDWSLQTPGVFFQLKGWQLTVLILPCGNYDLNEKKSECKALQNQPRFSNKLTLKVYWAWSTFICPVSIKDCINVIIINIKNRYLRFTHSICQVPQLWYAYGKSKMWIGSKVKPELLILQKNRTQLYCKSKNHIYFSTLLGKCTYSSFPLVLGHHQEWKISQYTGSISHLGQVHCLWTYGHL